MTVALTAAAPDFAALDVPLLVVALPTNPTLTDELNKQYVLTFKLETRSRRIFAWSRISCTPESMGRGNNVNRCAARL